MISGSKCRFIVAIVAALFLLTAGGSAAATPEQRAAELVARMTAEEKLDLVANGAAGVPRLGIPPLIYRDGPAGIGNGMKNVTSFPNGVTVGSTWDPGLARLYGQALAREIRSKGANGLLAPTVEPLRNPLWGRAGETYGEDPFLNGELAVSQIRGIQSGDVIAQAKHFAVNTQEYGRFGLPLLAPATDSQVSRRVLEEIYFPPFKAAVQRGGLASVMCSYNRIGGTPACQNPEILGALREWGLRGYIGPDAVFAVRNLPAAAAAGVDHFQLGTLPPGQERETLANLVPPGRIDESATRILAAMVRTGVLDAGDPVEKEVASSSAHRALATRIAAEGSVLLKNRRRHRSRVKVLPLGRNVRKLAVIGYDAGPGTQTQEGGSPAVNGREPVSPISAIRKLAPGGTKVSYTAGTKGIVPLPIVPASALQPSSGTGPGLLGEFYPQRSPEFPGAPSQTRVDATLDFDTTVGKSGYQALVPIPGTEGAGSARWTGTLTPPKSGRYVFSLTFAGNASLVIDGKRIVAGDSEFVQGASANFIGAPDITFQGVADLTAGKAVPIMVEYATSDSLGGAALKLGWRTPQPTLKQRAVAAARKADVAVVFANDVTAEGMDRTSLALPGDQDELIQAVSRANRNTVVVLHTGSAVLMPWKGRVAAIIEAWYPGQQSGLAIAMNLFGKVAPSGHLPVTFPASDAQNPTVTSPMDATGPENVDEFTEGLEVGYRFYDSNSKRPLFPFGHGLTYTTFRMGGFTVRRGGGGATVGLKLRNTGKRAGSEVVQAYVGFPPSAGEPPRQLKAFRKVRVLPGRSRKVKLRLGPESFRVYDEPSGLWVRPEGRFRIWVGSSSRHLPLSSTIAFG